MSAATSQYDQSGTVAVVTTAAISARNATWATSWIPVETPWRMPRSSGVVMSARRATYGSAATLKKIEKRKIAMVSPRISCCAAAKTKRAAESGIPTRM